MKQVNVFLKSANHPRFEQVLKDFAYGISDASVHICSGDSYKPCDVAVIFGSWKDRNTPWHNIKRQVVKHAPSFIVLETPLIGRGPVKEIMEDNWYRIGLNGFLADTGDFKNKNMPSDRWEKIQKELSVTCAPWHKEGEYIILTLQLPGDASLRGIDINRWAKRRLVSIRHQTDLPIVVRKPQLDRPFDIHSIVSGISKVVVQTGTKENLHETLSRAKCSVTYTSGLAVDSILAGTPTIAYNPGNFGYSISSNYINDINNLKYSDRTQWLNDLSYCQWSVEEIKEGLPWQHLMK